MKALIVDDERLARKVLRTLIEETSKFDEIQEADSVESALEIILQYKPDVVFLDIQLSCQDGFSLLEQVDDDFSTIFVTAYDKYAVKAFNVDAVDYLLKPVDMERLKKSIEKVELIHEVKNIKSDNDLTSRILLNVNGTVKYLKFSDIRKIYASGDYSIATTTNGNQLKVLKTLKEWEEKLPSRYFVRIHRSTIINSEEIENIAKDQKFRTNIFMRGEDTPLIISRHYMPRFRQSIKS